jgi:stage II sporulation protein D
MRRWVRRGAEWRAAALLSAAAIACSTAIACSAAAARQPAPASARTVRDASGRTVRIALAVRVAQVRLTADGPWRIYASDGRSDVALTQARETWVLERDGGRVSARREDSSPVSRRESPLVARAAEATGTITFNGRRYRGEIAVSVGEGGLVVVNRLPMDDYLKGVVPLEIGTNATADMAAVEAQAVAARSYAVTHLAGPARAWDMLATVTDQVYGGASAESAVGNDAVDATAGLVLQYDQRVVNAPYHASCGGTTAEPQDVWRTASEPYLQRVSDQVPGTTRFYCDQAPRHRWTRSFGEAELREAVSRYVRKLPGGGTVGVVRDVHVASVTPAGRVATLAIETDRRSLLLRGNEMRDALRSPSGELLYSTYFSVDAVQGRGGVTQLVLRGGGNGHGIGMCQSGAIGRARAGQDFRTILRTYYPGTTVGRID